MQAQWQKVRRFFVHNILHADDTPHALALGVAIATFVAIVPVIGMQTVVAVAIAAAFRANKAVCIPIVWLSNPVTALPINYACLWVGRVLLPNESGETIMQAIHRLSGVGGGLSLFSLAFWKERFSILMGLGLELWLGSVVVGAVLGAIAYPITRWAVTNYRVRHREKLSRKHRVSEDDTKTDPPSRGGDGPTSKPANPPAHREAANPSGPHAVQQDHGQGSKNENGNPGGQGGGVGGVNVRGDEGHDVAKPADQHALPRVIQHVGG